MTTSRTLGTNGRSREALLPLDMYIFFWWGSGWISIIRVPLGGTHVLLLAIIGGDREVMNFM